MKLEPLTIAGLVIFMVLAAVFYEQNQPTYKQGSVQE